jgi:sarcosine oxidase, subunit gamma
MDDAMQITDLPNCVRLILRGGQQVAAAAAETLGFGLPVQACRAAVSVGRAALWLGPDEWLVLAPKSDTVAHDLAQALQGQAHSLVDVSHRQVAIRISGPAAASLLNAGCPLDLHVDVFPVGTCTRTLLGKTAIVLWRRKEDSFHIEVARSFARYLRDFLGEAALR